MLLIFVTHFGPFRCNTRWAFLTVSAENLCIVFLQEQDILDMIAQCEADEMDGKNMASNKIKGPKVRTINLIFLIQDENSG